MMLKPGTYLQDRYEILSLIGTGGRSEVYQAKCHTLNRLVAIKVLKKVDDIGFCYLTSSDVVRHPLVQKIVQAYDDYEAKNQAKDRQRGERKNPQEKRQPRKREW